MTGATGGLGRAIAGALHDRGASLLLTGRKTGVLEDMKSELSERVEVLAADLRSAEELSALTGRASAVDVLVANAGHPGTGRLDRLDRDEIDEVIDVNLRAPIQLTRALLPAMLKRGSGHVVLISSLAGKVANPRSTLYSATKFGLRGFGLALHEELHGTGVGVTTVCPGFIRDAGMFVRSGTKLPPGMGTSSPEEVARAVIRGIESNKREIDVAPLTMRSGVRIFTVAPSVGSALSRALGAGKIAASIAEGHRDTR